MKNDSYYVFLQWNAHFKQSNILFTNYFYNIEFYCVLLVTVCRNCEFTFSNSISCYYLISIFSGPKAKVKRFLVGLTLQACLIELYCSPFLTTTPFLPPTTLTRDVFLFLYSWTSSINQFRLCFHFVLARISLCNFTTLQLPNHFLYNCNIASPLTNYLSFQRFQ